MTSFTLISDIEKQTNEIRKAIIQPDGSIQVKMEQWKYMNSINIDIINIDYSTLCELPRFLMRTSIFPIDNYFHNLDISHFLMWMAEIFSFRYDFNPDAMKQDTLFSRYFKSLLASQLFSITQLSMENIPFYLRESLGELSIFSACFSFAFLERCIRIKCSDFVGDDGLVLQDFNIPRYHRSDRKYVKGNYISNISHELKLLTLYVATIDFKDRLNRFMNELNEVSGHRLDDPFELISNWRNRLLHGENIWSTGLDVTTYLICMMLLDEIPEQIYNSKKDVLKDIIKFKQQDHIRAHDLWYRLKID